METPAIHSLVGQHLPALHQWYRTHARPLPWRKTTDPYAIWVSEAMLQQTQVATVVPYFTKWMQTFSTVNELAQADEQYVLKQWEGLGYYSRARNFHRAAKIVRGDYGGAVPADPDLFRQLPGVGAYTTAAVMSIAFGKHLAVVDGNVKRVLSRWFAIGQDIKKNTTVNVMQSLADALIKNTDPSIHNQAMMELGATICTPRNPQCAVCPMQTACIAHQQQQTARYPIVSARVPIPTQRYLVAVIRDDQQRLLLQKRPYGALLAGMWEFPMFDAAALNPKKQTDARHVLRNAIYNQYQFNVDDDDRIIALPVVKHTFTHFKAEYWPFVCRLKSLRASGAAEDTAHRSLHRWLRPTELSDYPMPRAVQRILQSATV